MRDAAGFEKLVLAAKHARATALHVVQGDDGLTILARIGGELSRFRAAPAPAPAPAEWFAHAAAHPLATRDDDRIVIDLSGAAHADCGLAALAMPEDMLGRLRGALRAGGGALLIASQDADALRRVMAAAAQAPGERYVARVPGGRDDLERAGRMDCDSILLGPCTDRAAIDTAFDLAQQGRRVVIGIDAETIVAAITQLRAWRVNRYGIALGLRALIAVRPERRLCSACSNPAQARGSDAALLGVDPGTVIYRPGGCAACGHSGFDGTALLFETVAIDNDLRRLLVEGGDATMLARHAFMHCPTLAASARGMAREGQISVDAAIAITREAGRAGVSGTGLHPHLLPSNTQRLDAGPFSPLSARLHGDRSSIG
ncbi:hypothetical protein ABS767_13880 [Sphingomonas sp. ST-64]|uniref:Bacterial type II secretion system protein E domain-containing protein n=1 Tax=Sphingomonas plantiphila TaxID=3163295 RepID=A0ABW8YSL4_9SPHN